MLAPETCVVEYVSNTSKYENQLSDFRVET